MNLDIINSEKFESFALEIFNYQFKNNLIYQDYCKQLKINSRKIKSIEKIPFLPISFFKSHKIVSNKKDTIDNLHFRYFRLYLSSVIDSEIFLRKFVFS